MAAAGALLAAGALFAPAASAAPVLYGATGVDRRDTLPASNLYTINPDTGATTSVGSIGKADHRPRLRQHRRQALRRDRRRLAGRRRAPAARINPATGASTVVGSLGANEIEDIAFTALGQLYGWNETGDDLYRINKATGAIDQGRRVGHGVTFGDGLAFDRNGGLWGLLDGDFGHVFTINPATGAVTTRRRI